MKPWRYWPLMPVLIFCGILFPGLARADDTLTAKELLYAQQYGAALVCDVLHADLSINGIHRVVHLIEVHGPWSEASATRIADKAIYTMCPHYVPTLQRLINQANRQNLV
jgi:hypothetical protein